MSKLKNLKKLKNIVF